MVKNSLKLLLPLTVVAWRYTELTQHRLNPLFTVGTMLLLWIYSLTAEKIKLRWLPALAGGILLPLLIRGLYHLGSETLFSLLGKSYGRIFFDSNWVFALPLYTLGIVLLLAGLRYKKWIPWYLLTLLLLLASMEFLFQGSDPLLDLREGLLFSGLYVAAALLSLWPSGSVEKRGLSFLLNLLFSGILALVILLLFQRYEEGSLKQGGGLLQTDAFRFDFSDYLQLQSEVSLSDDLVFLYRKEGDAQRMLLRRYLLTAYDEQGFHRESPLPGGEDLPAYLPPEPVTLKDPQFQGRSEIRQEFYLVNFHPNGFLALNYPVEIHPYQEWEEASFSSVYQVISQHYSESLWRLIRVKESELEPELLAHYTDFGEREDIQNLALEITEESARPFLKVQAIEQYFHENYYYSLKPGVAPDGDLLGHFLFESRKGYCSYYAFAMTLMCRSLGIPARVALGFWVDPQGEVLNFYPVLANQAHAWVEVYFNEYGWISFDPTSETMAPGEEIRWGQIDQKEFLGLIEEILENNDGLELKEAPPEDINSDISRPLGRIFRSSLKKTVPLYPLLYLLVLLWQRLPLSFLLRKKREKKIAALLNWIFRDLQRMSYHSSGLPREVEQRLKGEIPLLARLVDLYQISRFSGITPEIEIHWNRLVKTYRLERRKIPLKRRLRGILYPLPQRRKI